MSGSSTKRPRAAANVTTPRVGVANVGTSQAGPARPTSSSAGSQQNASDRDQSPIIIPFTAINSQPSYPSGKEDGPVIIPFTPINSRSPIPSRKPVASPQTSAAGRQGENRLHTQPSSHPKGQVPFVPSAPSTATAVNPKKGAPPRQPSSSPSQETGSASGSSSELAQWQSSFVREVDVILKLPHNKDLKDLGQRRFEKSVTDLYRIISVTNNPNITAHDVKGWAQQSGLDWTKEFDDDRYLKILTEIGHQYNIVNHKEKTQFPYPDAQQSQPQPSTIIRGPAQSVDEIAPITRPGQPKPLSRKELAGQLTEIDTATIKSWLNKICNYMTHRKELNYPVVHVLRAAKFVQFLITKNEFELQGTITNMDLKALIVKDPGRNDGVWLAVLALVAREYNGIGLLINDVTKEYLQDIKDDAKIVVYLDKLCNGMTNSTRIANYHPQVNMVIDELVRRDLIKFDHLTREILEKLVTKDDGIKDTKHTWEEVLDSVINNYNRRSSLSKAGIKAVKEIVDLDLESTDPLILQTYLNVLCNAMARSKKDYYSTTNTIIRKLVRENVIAIGVGPRLKTDHLKGLVTKDPETDEPAWVNALQRIVDDYNKQWDSEILGGEKLRDIEKVDVKSKDGPTLKKCLNILCNFMANKKLATQLSTGTSVSIIKALMRKGLFETIAPSLQIADLTQQVERIDWISENNWNWALEQIVDKANTPKHAKEFRELHSRERVG